MDRNLVCLSRVAVLKATTKLFCNYHFAEVFITSAVFTTFLFACVGCGVGGVEEKRYRYYSY